MYSLEPECLPLSLSNFFNSFSMEHINDLLFRKCWTEKNNLELLKKGIKIHDPVKIMFAYLKRK